MAKQLAWCGEAPFYTLDPWGKRGQHPIHSKAPLPHGPRTAHHRHRPAVSIIPGLLRRAWPVYLPSMADDSIRIEYNEELKPLEELLAGVRRAGDFFVSGVVEIPMPKVEIAGVGVLSFPVPPGQIAAQIQQHRLDMTPATDRTGSPQTLVCTKNRRTYNRRCEQYRKDIAALAVLAERAEKFSTGDAQDLKRIANARAQAAEWSPA